VLGLRRFLLHPLGLALRHSFGDDKARESFLHHGVLFIICLILFLLSLLRAVLRSRLRFDKTTRACLHCASLHAGLSTHGSCIAAELPM